MSALNNKLIIDLVKQEKPATVSKTPKVTKSEPKEEEKSEAKVLFEQVNEILNPDILKGVVNALMINYTVDSAGKKELPAHFDKERKTFFNPPVEEKS